MFSQYEVHCLRNASISLFCLSIQWFYALVCCLHFTNINNVIYSTDKNIYTTWPVLYTDKPVCRWYFGQKWIINDTVKIWLQGSGKSNRAAPNSYWPKNGELSVLHTASPNSMLHKKFHQQFLDIIYICAFTDLSYKTLVNCTNSYGYVSLLKKWLVQRSCILQVKRHRSSFTRLLAEFFWIAGLSEQSTP